MLCSCVQGEFIHHWLQAGHSGILNTKCIIYFILKYQHFYVSFLPFCIPVVLYKAKLICVPSPQSPPCPAAPPQQSSVPPVRQGDVSVLGVLGEGHQQQQPLHCFSLLLSSYWDELLTWPCVAVHKLMVSLIRLHGSLHASSYGK